MLPMGYTLNMLKIKNYEINNLSTLLFITLLLGVAQIYGEMTVEFVYSKTYVGACRALFPNPLWEWSESLVSAFIALIFLKVFKIKNKALNLFIALQLYLLGSVLLQYTMGTEYLWCNHFYEALYVNYVSKKTFIFSVTFLYLAIL